LTAARQLAALANTRVAHPSTTTTHDGSHSSSHAEPADGAIWRGVEGEWNEVVTLVSRVLPHLESRSYDTRQAAATALGLISKAVGIWDPSSTSSIADPDQDVTIDGVSGGDDDGLNLTNFDVSRLLAEGTLLLGSSGNEYSRGATNMSAEELAKAQKDALGKLGLGGIGGSGGLDDIGVDVKEELAAGAGGSAPPPPAAAAPPPSAPGGGLPPPKFKPNPSGSLSLSLTHSTSSASTAPAAPSTAQPPIAQASPTPPPSAPVKALAPVPEASQSAGDEDPYAGLSARERNKLKRKRKSEAKAGSSNSATPVPVVKAEEGGKKEDEGEDVKPDLSAGGGKSEAVVIDPGAKARERERLLQEQGGEVQVHGTEGNLMEVQAGEWPWRGTVEKLKLGLLSSNWETRHGAALGLKEVLRLQGVSGGKIAGLNLKANEERYRFWCEDLAAKLLFVFALDRFGDYVSDHVVAPVREAAAQALATLLPAMLPSSVVAVQRILIDMIEQNGAPPSEGLDSRRPEAQDAENGRKVKYVWQVRHSGLLGLKYLVAVRGDLLRGSQGEKMTGLKKENGQNGSHVKAEEEDVKMVKVEEEGTPAVDLLKAVTDAALLGLKDRDDDVRSAAAATLSPIAGSLVEHLPLELEQVIGVLWACLGDLKDDLSSSVGGVMDLLATLLGFDQVITLVQSPRLGYSLAELIPRLFPFFRHTISTVRLAVLKATIVFLDLAAINPSLDNNWVDDRLLRLVFQNLIVEEQALIRSSTATVWSKALCLLTAADPNRLSTVAEPHLNAWFSIMSTPIGVPIDTSQFWASRMSLSGQGAFIHNVDKAILAQDMALVSVDQVMRGRVAAAVAIGELLAMWPSDTHDLAFGARLSDGLGADSALRRFLTATIIEEWASASKTSQPLTETAKLASRLSKSLLQHLEADAPSTYAEMTLVLQRIQTDCRTLYAMFGKQGKVSSAKLPSVPDVFGIVQARQIITSFDKLVTLVPAAIQKTLLPLLQEQHRKISTAAGYFEANKAKYDRQVYASLAGAVISLRIVPPKLNPVIRSVTNSIKSEEDPDLQARSARSIAAFIDLCSSPSTTLKSNPTDKLIKNLCTFLCQDTTRTAVFSTGRTINAHFISLVNKPARGLVTKEQLATPAESEDVRTAKLVYRGAMQALGELADRFGADLIDRLPKLWNCMSDALLALYSSSDSGVADKLMAADEAKGQDLLDCLTVLPAGAQKLGESLHGRLAALFPLLSIAARSKFAIVRHAVARCFASLCNILPTEGLRHVVELVLPVIADPLNIDHRRGAMEVVMHIVDLLDVKVLPYIIFLVVPVLGRMSDSDDDVRLVATNTFASLIKLVPLEAGLPDPPGFPEELISKRQQEREFLTQLLDGSKVEEYKIPIPIGVELRKYQRDGVSWLAFLAKYQLHGLLCDDMGLGKTLQSICILGSKHFERAQRHAESGSADTIHLPSLVVCPPTLTGHWKHEIQTYASNLRPVIYTGNKSEREQLLAKIRQYDVVIISYDILRNDIESLGLIDWHYCILDEGHIIKNGKTKLTKAVKSVRSVYRLILSGTPIQNNVLELWSLFDFLMPGFLGSEKSFNERFGKPIAASRDAKSSSKEQEAGALALEALHKQVLPFLMRRLKEDVLDDLPPKIIQDHYCELSPLQKQLYDDFSTSQGKQVAEGELKKSGDSAGKEQSQHVFQALQYLRKLVNHPALVIKPDLPKHKAIISSLESTGGNLRDVSHAPKLAALRQILLDCGIGNPTPATDDDGGVSQHRVLIFCQLKQMLDIVENDLFRALMPSVTYMRMDGSTDVSKRHAVVQTFNADPSIDCLLLTTHVGGLGLNLTGADTVIFVEHDWNPMKDLQAMDRAHRLGQKKVVNVYRLITRGTLEEKIMGLQRFKLNIASSVVNQQNADLSLAGTDVLDLFNVSNDDSPAAAPAKDGPVSQKAILDGLGDLPPEDEYQDLDFTSFTASLS
ncbi:hypothetical protein T439DRAFT_368083, partial [Meredithblackwellia eburnea MCA 4105]